MGSLLHGLITSFVMYSLFCGANSFFAAGNTSGYNLDPSSCAGMGAQLGAPPATMRSSFPDSKGQTFRTYSPGFEGGTVYLNWTGSTQTISLNPQVAYYDPHGN